MKLKYIHFLSGLLICGICTVSCKEEEDVLSYDPEWKAMNEAYFLSHKDSAEYIALVDTLANSGDSIYYKILETRAGKTPCFTDTVNVTYKGWITKKWDTEYETDSIFDTTAGSRYEFLGAPFGVASGTISGWRLALQYMKVGDKWEVVIPSSMAYGSTGKGSIPPYSTLNFEMQLVSITRNGATIDQIPDIGF